MAMKMRAGRPLRATRGVQHAHSYRPLLRLADNFHGRQDSTDSGDQQLVSKLWYRRMEATRLENDHRLFAKVGDRLRDPVSALDEALGHVLDCDARLPELVRGLAQISPADLCAVGGAETHLTKEAVAMRRGREHRARVEAATAPLSALHAGRQTLVLKCLALRSQIAEEFGLAQTVSERMRNFYSRRISTYARQLGRGSASAGDLDFHLDPALWTQRPCPWLPRGLDVILNLPAVWAVPPTGTTVKEENL